VWQAAPVGRMFERGTLCDNINLLRTPQLRGGGDKCRPASFPSIAWRLYRLLLAVPPASPAPDTCALVGFSHRGIVVSSIAVAVRLYYTTPLYYIVSRGGLGIDRPREI